MPQKITPTTIHNLFDIEDCTQRKTSFSIMMEKCSKVLNLSHQMLRAKYKQHEAFLKATKGRFRKILLTRSDIRAFGFFLEEPKVFNIVTTSKHVHYIPLLPIHCLLKRIDFIKSHQKRSWSAYRR